MSGVSEGFCRAKAWKKYHGPVTHDAHTWTWSALQIVAVADHDEYP